MSRITQTKVAAPATPATNKGTQYLDTTDFRQKVIDANGVISQLFNIGDFSRNFLDNGDFRIQQRQVPGSTAIAGISTTTRGGQVADRWAVTSSVASNLNWQQVDARTTVETGLLAAHYGSIIASSAGKKVLLSQWIIGEDVAALRGRKVRLSVKLNQKVGNAQTFHLGLIQLNSSGTVDTSPAFLSGAFSTSAGVAPAWGTNLAAIAPDASPTGENGTINGNYLDITTQQTVWARSSCVFSVPSNCLNLIAVLWQDTTGGTTDNISIAEFQMTCGPDIVDYIPEPWGYTFYRCARFFQKSFPYAILPAASVTIANGGYGAMGTELISGSGTTLAWQLPINFPVVFWKVPTLTLYTPTAAGAQIFRHTGTTPAVQASTVVVTNSLTEKGCLVSATNEATTNGAVGNLGSVHWSGDTDFLS